MRSHNWKKQAEAGKIKNNSNQFCSYYSAIQKKTQSILSAQGVNNAGSRLGGRSNVLIIIIGMMIANKTNKTNKTERSHQQPSLANKAGTRGTEANNLLK